MFAALAVLFLVAAGAGCFVPWYRVGNAAVLVPLVYMASVLFTVLATGSSTSGIGILVLAPVIWTALYHRRWESAVVVVAAVGFQVVTSLTPAVLPDAVILRRVVFWTMLGALLSVATHRLRGIATRQVRAREADLRRTIALGRASEELTAILDPDEVIEAATRLAAELVAPEGASGRRAQYCRVHDDQVTLVTQFDETGLCLSGPFALADHPNLLSAFIGRRPVAARLDPKTAGPSVRELIDQLGEANSIYVPVIREGRVDGILAVSIRGGEPVPPELIEQCKALGHLVELALTNAWSHREMGRLATTDLMTGLPNRRGFDQFIANRPGRGPFVALAIDVDGLKQVNDSHGHDAGDAYLAEVARSLQVAMRRGDVLARVGGHEFVAYLVDASEKDGRLVAARMLSSVAHPTRMLPATVSIGIGVGAPTSQVADVLLSADTAMYDAKRAGGNCCAVASFLSVVR
jgi:diguanylate cyclase (GGDEF)-like protein